MPKHFFCLLLFFCVQMASAASYQPLGKPYRPGYVQHLSFSQDSRHVLIGSYRLQIYRVHDRDLVTDRPSVGRSGQSPIAAWWSKDHKMVRWLQQSGLQREALLARTEDEYVFRLTGHRGIGMRTATYSADGLVLASGSNGGSLVLTNTHTGRKMRQYQAPWGYPITDISLRLPVIAAASKNDVVVWDRSLPANQPIKTLNSPKKEALAVDFSSDGKDLLVGYSDGSAAVWSTSKWGQTVSLAKAHAGGVRSVDYRQDGKMFATGGAQSAKIWDPQGKLIQTLTIIGVARVRFSPDGHYLAVYSVDGSRNQEVQIYAYK